MTTELEKQFFDTFGVEPKELIFSTMNCACGCHDCKNCEKYKNNFSKIYPKITDRHYLELLFVLTRNCYQIEICNALTYQGINEFTVNLIKEPTRYHSHSEDFKIALLKAIKMISDDEDIKIEVQAIFKGER